MEIRANYIALGAFTLLSILAIFLFLVWVAGTGGNTEKKFYDIYFADDISGLSPANDVLLNGIKIGEVSVIKICPKDPELVQVTVRVDKDAPIRQDSSASLSLRGVTGTSIVSISAGTKQSPFLEPQPGEDHPVIPSRLSRLEKIFASAPELMGASVELLDRLNNVVSDKNQQALTSILQSVAVVTAGLEARTSNMEQAILNIETASKKMGQMADAMYTAAETTRSAAETARSMSENANILITTMQPGLTRFSTEGIDEFHRLLGETRLLISSLNRVTQNLEKDPQRYIFGSPFPELELPK